MSKILGIGEMLLRLTPPHNQKLIQTSSFDANYGGAEANVIFSLASLGVDTKFATKMPNNDIAKAAISLLRNMGTDTSNVIYENGKRMGIYFSEIGYSVRPNKIVYDRKNSAFAYTYISEFNLDNLFEDVSIIHLSGISPALSLENQLFIKKICEEAKKRQIKISFDLNFRSTLWDFDYARNYISTIAHMFDLCIGVEPIKLIENDYKSVKDSSINETLQKAKLLHQQYNISYIAFTRREIINASKNALQSFIYDGKNDKLISSDIVTVDILERIGTGDAFAAGLLYCLHNNYELQEAITFANACFALKHTIRGDLNYTSYTDVISYLNSRNNFEISR